MRFSKFLEIFKVQLKNNYVREAVYRSNFVTTIVVDLVWMAVEFGLFAVIYSHTTSIAGWTQDQVFFFLGFFFATGSLESIFLQSNFWRFSDLVNQGELDTLLLKPVPTLYLALTRYMNLTGAFNLLLGFAIMIRYAEPAGFEGGWLWLAVPLWMIFGLVITLLIRFSTVIVVFWTDRSWALSRIYYQLYQFATKPDSLFPVAFRWTMLTVLPFAFIGSVPVRSLLKGLNSTEYLVLTMVTLSYFFFDRMLWKKALVRYQSASS